MGRTEQKDNQDVSRDEGQSGAPVGDSLQKTISRIKAEFGESSDLVVNYLKLGSREDCADVYIKGLADAKIINYLSLELSRLICEYRNGKTEKKFELLMDCFSGLWPTRKGTDMEDACRELLSGNTLFFLDGCGEFLSVNTKSNEGRAIEEPTSQTIIKGPKDAFTENIDQNVYLIRKRLRNKNLRIEPLTAGSVTHTELRLVYLNGIAKAEILQEIRRRLSGIQIDRILESNYLEEYLKDDKYTIFPEILNSEKPDSVAAALLEGRVAILVDGTPYVLTAPALAVEFIQVSEDYYHNFIVSSFIRILRLVAFILTLLVPSAFISITTFHQEMIPTQLLISIAAQREDVPFPAFLEVLMMEITFELLREAGIRMPKAIGSAISIVGALVLGQAAVEAGLISAAVVIVVSITAIASFAIPDYSMSNAIRIMRFLLILIGGVLGLYGVSVAVIILTLHLCSLKSITIPYLSPVAPKIKGGGQDIFIRFPLWNMKGDPTGIATAKTRTDVGAPATMPEGKPEMNG